MRTGRPKATLTLTAAERQHLESMAHRSRTVPQLARRARIVLACAGGADNTIVAQRLHVRRRRSGNGARGLYGIGSRAWSMSRGPARPGWSATSRSSR